MFTELQAVRDPNPKNNSLTRKRCCKRRIESLICRRFFLIKELSLGLGCLCLLPRRHTSYSDLVTSWNASGGDEAGGRAGVAVRNH